MKTILSSILLILAFASVGNANLEMRSVEDDSVSASLIGGYTSARSRDSKLSASLVTVFRGGAAGMSSIIVTFYDTSDDSGSDIGNSVAREILYVTDAPKSAKIIKKADKTYELQFKAEEVSQNDEGNYVYPTRNVVLRVVLDNNNAIKSIEMK